MTHPATQRVTRAATIIFDTLNPGDELGGRDDLDEFIQTTWTNVQRKLGEAESLLRTGLSGREPDLPEAMRLIREASDEFELTSGLVGSAPREVGIAYADALRELDALTGR